MQIGLVGLGKMGANMRQRMRDRGIEVVGYDRNPDVSDVGSLAELAAALPAGERVVWVMVPSGPITDGVINELAGLLTSGDVVIDGGNSFYQDDVPHAELLARTGVGFIDAGVSGGVWGLENGYGLMVGGEPAHVERVLPVFDALRPDGPREEGFVHAGTVGAGHYAKMVHNGIEYGLMQAYAEGFDILRNAAAPTVAERERLELDVAAIAETWRHGSVVGSWLLDLAAAALAKDPELSKYSGVVADSGEGRWALMAAIEERVPADVLAAALHARFRSQKDHTYAEKMLSALREAFGGHQEKA